MLERPRFKWFRRYFFPYSGEEALTGAQCRRLVASWALFFSLALTIATIPVVLAIGSTLSFARIGLTLLCILLGGGVIFGLMACFVVYILNRSARIRQQWNEKHAARMSSTSGGRYGS
jgi:hypothetical protein